MISYTYNIEELNPDHLNGFFVGWSNPPSPQTHLQLLQRSSEKIVAIDQTTDAVVGFVTAVTDGTLCAYIPLLEVLPSFQGQGIGSELVRKMLDRLKGYYMIDIVCDDNLFQFYERFKMTSFGGLCKIDPSSRFAHSHGSYVRYWTKDR